MTARELVHHLLTIARGVQPAATASLEEVVAAHGYIGKPGLDSVEVISLACALAVEREAGSPIDAHESIDGETVWTSDGREWDVTTPWPVLAPGPYAVPEEDEGDEVAA